MGNFCDARCIGAKEFRLLRHVVRNASLFRLLVGASVQSSRCDVPSTSRRWHRRHADISALLPDSNAQALPLVDGTGLEAEAFLIAFDKPGQPAVFRGLQDSWAGKAVLRFPSLRSVWPVCVLSTDEPGAIRARHCSSPNSFAEACMC